MGGLDSSKGWCPRKQNGKVYSFDVTRFNVVRQTEEVHKKPFNIFSS